MNEIKQISSLQNPLVKKVVVLKEKSRERRSTKRFVLEGRRELELALKSGYQIETLFFNAALLSEKAIFDYLANWPKTPRVVALSKAVYQKIAYRETTEGLVAIAESKSHVLADLRLKDQPLLLVAEAPEKPGNIGALLRTADAAGIDAVIIADPKGDLYNPNIIRSSVGGVFTNQIAMAPSAEVIAFLKEKGIAMYGAALTASVAYTEVDYTRATAIVVGTEATGLSKEWLDHCTQNIIIPMRGALDSMNVSVSAAIVIFEAIRQRG